jgi:hypothetical protein
MLNFHFFQIYFPFRDWANIGTRHFMVRWNYRGWPYGFIFGYGRTPIQIERAQSYFDNL